MVHQSKTIVDAAADAGVKFIVHLGIFGNGRLTHGYGSWHEMVERYIEGSGVAWTHLHPPFLHGQSARGSSCRRWQVLLVYGKPEGWLDCT
jgi:uncharacterized protein YbjT (DUF2867 family)